MVVFVCSVNSAYFEDSLTHVECVFGNIEDAIAWKREYEKKVKKNKGLVVRPPSNGDDKELDRFITDKKIQEFASKFISTEIEEFKVL